LTRCYKVGANFEICPDFVTSARQFSEDKLVSGFVSASTAPQLDREFADDVVSISRFKPSPVDPALAFALTATPAQKHPRMEVTDAAVSNVQEIGDFCRPLMEWRVRLT